MPKSYTAKQNYSSLTMIPAQLKAFLTEAPLLFNVLLTEGAKEQILTNCYRSLWGDDLKLMEKYFFTEGLSNGKSLTHLLEKYQLFGTQNSNTFDNVHSSEQNLSKADDNAPEYWESQRGKHCGHLFKKGESLYRCRNCGLDDTCVMCSRCFHSTNHEGHDVKIWISKGAGGCCDCGDPEAWKVPLICSIHSLNVDSNTTSQPVLEPLSSVPQNVIDSVRETIVVAMDYILETFATSPEDVVSVGTVESIKQDCIDSHRALGLPVEDPDQTYACVLWNDEKHSFDAVIDIVMEAIHCTDKEAAFVAECVDVYGRHVVKESADIKELIEVANKISSIHLAVTVCSSQKTIREAISGLLLNWLKELSGGRYRFFNNVDGGNSVIRDIICEVMSKDWALRADVTWLSTRYRRERMPENESDNFTEGDGNSDMDEDEDMMFGDQMDEINEADILLDEDQIDDFFNSIAEVDENGSNIEYLDDSDVDLHGNEEDDEEEENEEDEEDEDSSDYYEEAKEYNSIDLEQDSQMEDVHHESSSEPHSNNVQQSSPSPSFARTVGHETVPNEGSSVAAEESESLSSSQEHKAEALKRRRQSGSSQSKATKTQKSRDILDIDWGLDSWVEYTEQLESQERELAQQLGTPIASNTSIENDMATSHSMNNNLKKEFRRKLRLDYLLQFDLRLWKTARISIKDLLIGTFISNFNYRSVLGIRFARNYPELVDAFFFKDREPENSVTTLSVQLLTAPTVASMLVKDYKFFGMVCSILKNFFLTDHVRMMLPEEYSHAHVDCSSRAILRHRYAYTIYDLRYVLNAEQVKVEISKNPLHLRHFLSMLYQFQEMDAFKRELQNHVEFESRSWIAAFNITLQTSKLCRLMADCFNTAEVSAVDSCRNLCRTIHRVLREVSGWKPVLLPRNEDDNSPDNRVLIKGLGEQVFHKIATPNAGSYDIIKYDVSTDYVSFHHPFHWLLSELFENVNLLEDGLLNEIGWFGGLKQMVNAAFTDKEQDVFLALLDYPIRTLALLSQINSGVWVRNGYNIRNQCASYRDVNVRENTLDCDIYLLQVGLTICNSNQLLLTLMDRFQLVDWFRGKYNKTSCYDNSQLISIVEDFLNLLIVCATEHSYASGATLEQRIRQSIIQYLGISNLAYSELLKDIPESLSDHESFEVQLNQIANFKAPDGLNDKGLYEIKPEYIDQINPYFWHYTRNQREEAHTVLKKRWNQSHPDQNLGEKDEFLYVPNVKKIQVGPFKHLGKFLHSEVLCQIIAYSIWDAKFNRQSRNDVILDAALHLAMVAVVDPNSTSSELLAMKVKGKFRADAMMDESAAKNFIQLAETNLFSVQVNEMERTQATLLTIILRCLEDNQMEHAHKRLGFLLDKIEFYGSDASKELIGEWKERRSHEINKQSENNEAKKLSQVEEKKAAAKARQAAIMSQFANAQSKFLEQHAHLYVSDEETEEPYEEPYSNPNELGSNDDMEVTRQCHFPADNCIVCQEELNESNLYGVLGFIQKSNLHRFADMTNSVMMTDILETSAQDNPWAPREESSTKTPSFMGFPTDSHGTGLDISSCGHMMHAECFDSYNKSTQNEVISEITRLFPMAQPIKTRFLCPLCKALGNILVPVVWKGKKEVYPGVMAPTSAYSDLGQSIIDQVDMLHSKLSTMPGHFDNANGTGQNKANLVISDESALTKLYNKVSKVAHDLSDKEEMNIEAESVMHEPVFSLFNMYAHTIGNFEIAQRGTEGTRARDLTVEFTGTFIDDISSTSQTFLKILSMTNLLVPDLMNASWKSDGKLSKERASLAVIFQFMPHIVTQNNAIREQLKPLLMDDPFKALVRLSLALNDLPSIEIHHILRSLYLAELTKIVGAIARSMLNNQTFLNSEPIRPLIAALKGKYQDTAGASSIHAFSYFVLTRLRFTQEAIRHLFKMIDPSILIGLIRTFALPFLRKSLLFMVVQHGFIPQNPSADMEGQSEFDNLLHILKLPTMDQVFELDAGERDMLDHWCRDLINYMAHHSLQTKPALLIHLPTQYRMTTLPYLFDDLIDESLKRACRKCMTVPEHSAICLICGTFVCARRFCCTEKGKGECNLHMKDCGGEIGIYLMVKDCFLLLLHDNGGYIMNAPYLDTHGEADVFLKRGTRQYLNNKRYEQIRQMWLNQSIPSFVRRKMEVAYTSTIWEAF